VSANPFFFFFFSKKKKNLLIVEDVHADIRK